jgi:hypothetical protein
VGTARKAIRSLRRARLAEKTEQCKAVLAITRQNTT